MRATPHPFTLRQLQYIVAVAERLSFRRAAAACHVSQPSLSSQVAAVEGAAGLRIFERGRGGVLLTPAGKDFVARARALLVGADELADAATRLADPLAGRLRIGVIPTISPYLLPEVATSLRRALPRLRIAWTEEKTPTLVSWLHSGELDGILLALEADLGPVDHAVVARDAFVLATSAQDARSAGATPLRLDALDSSDMLLLAEGHCLRDQALRACGSEGAAHVAGLAATSLPTLARMVAAGEGITLLPELAMAVENRRGDLRLRRLRQPEPGRTIVVAWRRGSTVGSTLARLAEILRAAYPRPPGSGPRRMTVSGRRGGRS